MTGTVDSDDHYRRADDDDENEDEHDSAERSEGGLAPTPALRTGERTHRSSEDGLPVKIAAELICELLHGGVPPGRLFLQALEADRLQVARQLRIQHTRGDRFRVCNAQQCFVDSGAEERRAPREAFVEYGAQRVDVRGRTDLLFAPRRQFRGKVVWRTEHMAGQGDVAASVQRLGQAEVGEVRLVEQVDEDVGWLEITMHDAGGMGNAHGFGERGQVGGSLSRRQWTVTQPGRQGTPLHKFHGQIVLALDLADVMDGYDVGMTQSGGRPCFALEALHGLFAGELPK